MQAEETVRGLEALLEQARIRGVHLEASLKVRAASIYPDLDLDMQIWAHTMISYRASFRCHTPVL